jgi:hypothetical protein
MTQLRIRYQNRWPRITLAKLLLSAGLCTALSMSTNALIDKYLVPPKPDKYIDQYLRNSAPKPPKMNFTRRLNLETCLKQANGNPAKLPYYSIIEKAAQKVTVEVHRPHLAKEATTNFIARLYVESEGDWLAVSKAGAVGISQYRPLQELRALKRQGLIKDIDHLTRYERVSLVLWKPELFDPNDNIEKGMQEVVDGLLYAERVSRNSHLPVPVKERTKRAVVSAIYSFGPHTKDVLDYNITNNPQKDPLVIAQHRLKRFSDVVTDYAMAVERNYRKLVTNYPLR